MHRLLIWLVTLPFALASVLGGHVVAYRVTGASPDGVHGYLAHAPEVLFVLVSLALLGLAVDSRARRRSPVPPAVLAVAAFVAQEHLERFAHTGHLPFLLTSPTLWLGVALQLPLAVAIWLLARWLAEELAALTGRRARQVTSLPFRLPVYVAPTVFVVRGPAHPGRGPPLLG